MKMRKESDSLGEIKVPEKVYWGAQTARSLHHFSIGQEKIPREVIRSYARLKRAAAKTNGELGLISPDRVELIVTAATEIIDGELADQFPLSVWQTGSGTQTNMNLNEVIACRANEIAGEPRGSKSPVHPNDHVNCSQSSNDTFPTVMHLAAVRGLKENLLPKLDALSEQLQSKATQFEPLLKIGRTHLMDAVPLTLGQEFSGYAAQIKHHAQEVEKSLPALYELAIGATAVGTGLNAPPEFSQKVCKLLSSESGLPFRPAANKFAALAAHDPLVSAHGALRGLACALIKIATDLSLLGSGPRCGFGELIFPKNEPGSSIMPGKVNPTQCEALTMIAVHVLGNDQAIAIGGSRGNFELNVLKPMIIYNFLNSIELLSDGIGAFTTYFLSGLEANREQLSQNLERSLMLVTALSPRIGYDKAAEIAQKAYNENCTLKEACIDLGYLDAKEFDELINALLV